MTVQGSSSFWHLPSTMLGRLAVGLAAVSVIMFFLQDRLARFLLLTQIPAIKLWLTYFLHLSYEYMFSKGFMVTFGLIAGIVGFFAVIGKHERSWLVWMIILLTILLPPIAVGFLGEGCGLLWTMMTFGLIAGIVGLVVAIRKHERSRLIWMIILSAILVPIAVTFLNVIYLLLWTLEHGRY
jgi:hypothetical protein